MNPPRINFASWNNDNTDRYRYLMNEIKDRGSRAGAR